MKIKIIPLLLAALMTLSLCACSDTADKSSFDSVSAESSDESSEETTQEETEETTEPAPFTEVSEDEKNYCMKGFTFNIGTALRRYNGAYSDTFDYTFRLINDVYQMSVVGVIAADEVRGSAAMFGRYFLDRFSESFIDLEEKTYDVNGFDAHEFTGTNANNEYVKMRFVTISSPKGTLLSFMAIYYRKYDEQYDEALQAVLNSVTYDETAVKEDPSFDCPEFSIKSEGGWGISRTEGSAVYFGYTKSDSLDALTSLVAIEAESSSARNDAETEARLFYDRISIGSKNKPKHEECIFNGYNAHCITYCDDEGYCYESYFFETQTALYSINIMLKDTIYDELIDSARAFAKGVEIKDPDVS